MQKTLKEFYDEHSGKVSDKWSIYLNEYDRIFSNIRNNPINMLEIGIQNGGSLEIWINYFSDIKTLVGCDINEDCRRLTYDDSRIKVVVGDVNLTETEKLIANYSGNYDLIIDDGSHQSSDIIKTFARYFSHLNKGGIYVVEDLHCSYWQEFQGGLFYPYSSINFFKRLADVISHEHWGIMQPRQELLHGFAKEHDIEFNEDLLAQIHSIEFINSICVIKKLDQIHNQLGPRIIAGELELVVEGHSEKNNATSIASSQINNYWSNLQVPPDEQFALLKSELANGLQKISTLELTINDLTVQLSEELEQTLKFKQDILSRDQQILLRDNQLSEVYNANFWRITWPLRFVASNAKRTFHIAKLILALIKRLGGLKNTLRLAADIYGNNGMKGIKEGLIHVNQSTAISPVPGSDTYDRNDYAEWMRRYDRLTYNELSILKNRLNIPKSQLISVLMPTYNTNPIWLIEVIESVRKQSYLNWELCIADDASTNKDVREILEKYAQLDTRIKVIFRENNGHISAASNSALTLVKGQWVALLDHDDILNEHALLFVANCIAQNTNAALIYSDEDKINQEGTRCGPYFKCSWNRTLFYSHNLISHLGVYRTDIVKLIGGFRAGFEGSQDYDLALRFIEHIENSQIHHIPRVLYHWRIHAESTALSNDAKPYAMIAGQRALNDHFNRLNVNATATLTDVSYRVRYHLPQKLPLVSLIIPTRNGLHLIKQCINSILEKTTYQNYEILIIDNGSDDLATLAYFEELADVKSIRIIRDDGPFNYSALNNSAVKKANGEIIGLLNNDIEVISPDWLSEMVSLAIQPNIGAVGARLWYPNNTLQHGGVVLGIEGVAGHSHKGGLKTHFGYLGRSAILSEYTAVTAACLVIKKQIFNQVGGLDETNLTIAYSDVDFCLRVYQKGFKNVWTPYAELYHHESATRGDDDTPEKASRFNAEIEYMKKTWVELLSNDPAYSPNLTLYYEDFSLAWPPRVKAI